ncbi:hypothetical protein Zmor_017366 [Zophobas morio]|uniref:Protein translocase subunit SecA n=1 Tax=Zophobas morio TaxID=2755281 RepID=A0AA38I9G5_9CUCU|nr:hypothetical protein Zmor_017366 [Zophobas morio]
MQRNNIKKAKPLNVSYKPFLEEEVDNEEILWKFISIQPYNRKNVKKASKFLMNRSQFDYKKQYRIFKSLDEFVREFSVPENEGPLFVVLPKSVDLWVVFCLVWEDGGESTVLYKDSSGASVPLEVEKTVTNLVPDVEFIVHKNQDHEEDEDFLYGPLCLRNLEILLKFFEKEPRDVAKEFLEISFCKGSDINKQKFDAAVSLTFHLSKNAKFKAYLQQFVKKLPRKLASDVADYHKILKEELEKDEKDVNHERLEEARKKCLQEEDIKKFSEDFKIHVDEKAQEYRLEAAEDFSKDMKRMRQIFLILQSCENDERFPEALETVHKQLGVDYNEIKSLGQQITEQEETKEDDSLVPEDISTLVEDIAKNGQHNEEIPSVECTPMEDLLPQIHFHMDQDDPQQEQTDLKRIQDKLLLVKTKYEKWKDNGLEAINKWAKKKKGHLGTDDNSVCEAIAVMDRAFNLLKYGRRLRSTQILSILIFFHDRKNQGQLCQIQTGEGKTLIVCLLAVIKALQGLTVDVITSNPVLAQDAVNENKDFYKVFGLTVACNNYGQSKKCYTANILYGSICSFQFDFLTDSCQGTNMRQDRGFGQVILDEVDSMLIDNGAHIAKLASPYPGMESLKYIYIKIWQELHKAEKSYCEEVQTKIQNDSHTCGINNLMHEESTYEMENYLTEKIKASDPTNIALIPFHLRNYARSKLDVLITNALHAKYHCHEHQQYRLIVNDEGERVIAPVDYLNTGVTMNNTVWCNGLHQFVQLKHNLHLTSESLTSSFISNIGYIKKYQDKNIFGMTGTLGSQAEQQLLSKVYNVNYAKIPTYKTKVFEEYPMVVVDDDKWVDRVIAEVLKKINNERAVLVICETEKDLLSLNQQLTTIQKTRVYANEDNAKEPEEPVKIGDIILATNIAGRGTNFRTQEDLELKGGLHVCVGFLPCNLRVEEQAFGRTSRQGNKGSAQIIVRQSGIEHLNIEEVRPGDDEIKRMRDLWESARLEEIKNVLVKELMFKDQLFGLFLKFYGDQRRSKRKKQERFVLDDLKEFWAFWLEKKDFKVEEIEKTSAQAEFDKFREDAKHIIGGRICHNPYYCLGLAEYHLMNDDRKEASQVLQQAIEMSDDKNLNLLAGAYLKLFHIAILDGRQIMYRFKKAVGNLFFITVNENTKYKTDAIRYLQKAGQAIDNEINYINTCLMSEDNSFCAEEALEDNEDENLFLKHMCSRLSCLKLHKDNVESLIEQINQLSAVAIQGKTPTAEEQFQDVFKSSELNEVITSHELHEVQSIGIDTLFALREVHDVPPTVIRAAQIQIGAGIAALTTGLVFLPVFPIMSPIAATLISEGLLDIIFEILSQGYQEFDRKAFMKSKFISYGISILTFGLSAALQSKVILDKAIEYCQRLSKFLRGSTRFKSICERLAKVVDKIQKYFEKLRLAAELKNLTKAQQLTKLKELSCTNPELFAKLDCGAKLEKLQALEKLGKLQVSRVELLLDFTMKTGTKIVKHPALYNNVVKPIENEVFEKLFNGIMKELRNSVNKNNDLRLKLITSPRHDIDKAVEKLLNETEFKTVVGTIYSKLSEKFDVVPFNQILSSAEAITNLQTFLNYADNFASNLEKLLDYGGTANNNVDQIIEEVCRRVAAKIIAFLKECYNNVKKVVSTARKLRFNKELIISAAENFVMEQMSAKILDKLRFEMKRALKESIKGRSELMEKLRTTEQAAIFAVLDQLQRDHGIAQFQIAFAVLKSLEIVPVGRVVSSGFSVTICTYKFVKCSSKFAADLEAALRGGCCDNKVADIIEMISSKMVDFLLPLLEKVIAGTIDLVSAIRSMDNFRIEDIVDNLPTIAANMVDVLMYEFRGKFFQLVTKMLISGCKKLASLVEKLRTTPLDQINTTVSEILSNDTVKILQLFYELYETLEGMSKTKLLSGSLETIFKMSGVSVYIGQFALSLEKRLQGGNENNNTDEIIEDICSKLMKSVEPLLEQLFFQRNNTGVTVSTSDKFSRIINLVWNLLQPKIIEAFKRNLRRSIRKRGILMEKLRTSYYNVIKKEFNDVLKKSLFERLLTKLVPEVLVSFQREFGKSGVAILSLSFDISIHLNDLRNYQDTFAQALENVLTGGLHNNDVDTIIDEIESEIMKIVTPLLQKIYENTKNIIGVVQEDNSTNFDDAPIDTEKIKNILITEIEESLANELVKFFENSLRKKLNANESLKDKLRTNPSDEIVAIVDIVMNTERNKILAFLQQLCQSLQSGTHDFRMLFTAIRAGLDLTHFILYVDKFVFELETRLHLGNENNNFEDIIFDVCMAMSKFVGPLIKEVLNSGTNFARQKNKSLKSLPEVLDITKKFLWKKISDRILEEFKQRLNISIKNRKPLMLKLQTTNRKFIVEAVRKLLAKGLLERLFRKLVPQCLNLLEDEMGKSVVVLVSSSFQLTLDLNDIFNYVNNFAAQLDYGLKGGSCNNDVGEMIVEVEFNVVMKVSPLLENVYQQLSHFKSAVFGEVEDFTDINATLTTTVDIVIREICISVIDQMVKMIIQALKNFLEQSSSLENKLRTATMVDINAVVANILAEDGIKTKVRGFTNKILEQVDTGLDESATNFLTQGIADLANIVPLINNFASKLEERLSTGEENNDIDEVVGEICLDVAIAIRDCLKNVYENMADVVGNIETVKKKKKMFVEELEKQLSCLKTRLKSYL